MKTISLISLLSLLVFLASCTETTYFGLRIAKSCQSMLKDNLKLAEDIHKDITHVTIDKITETQGDWWNKRTLTLTNIKAVNFRHENKNFTLDKCNMVPTGILQALAHGDGFVWDVSFEWDFEFFSMNPKGAGTAEITSQNLEFIQSYLDGIPDTNMYIKWNVTKQNLGTLPLPMLHDWIMTMLIEKLTPKLTLKLNMHTDPMNKEIIKPYEKIFTENKKGNIIVKNDLYDATEALYDGKSYAVVDYSADLTIEGNQIHRKINTPTKSSVDSSQSQPFDYSVCYSAKLFAEYMQLMFNADYFLTVATDVLKIPTTVGFYKGLYPELSNHYGDDEKVKITCNKDSAKEIQYVDAHDALLRKLLIPFQCRFEIEKSNELFMVMNPVYEALFSVGEKEEHIKGVITSVKVHTVETVPAVDFQGKFIAIEVADMFAEIFEFYEIAGPTGFHVGTVRSDKYQLTHVDLRPNDVCLLYTDKE